MVRYNMIYCTHAARDRHRGGFRPFRGGMGSTTGVIFLYESGSREQIRVTHAYADLSKGGGEGE